jgi:hypothetical protein
MQHGRFRQGVGKIKQRRILLHQIAPNSHASCL